MVNQYKEIPSIDQLIRLLNMLLGYFGLRPYSVE